MQRRFGDFGTPDTSEEDKSVRSALHRKGVYSDFNLSVDTLGNLLIQSGFALQPDGIVWTEDNDVTLTFSPPGSATNYTVVARHEDRQIQGGTAVLYTIDAGLLAEVTDGVIIGWIRHPGGGVPLDPSHLQIAPRRQSNAYTDRALQTQPVDLVAPLPRTYLDPTSVGLDVTVTDLAFDTGLFILYQDVSTPPTAVGNQGAIQHIQFYVEDGEEGPFRPVGYDFFINVSAESGTALTVEVLGTDQAPVTITSGSPIGTTTGYESKSVEVDRLAGVFAVGQPYTLRLTYAIDPGGSIKIGRIRARFVNYPVT
jgi:hypothetical protein